MYAIAKGASFAYLFWALKNTPLEPIKARIL